MLANFWHVYGTQILVALATLYLRYQSNSNHGTTRKQLANLISQLAKIVAGSNTANVVTPESPVPPKLTPGGPLINPGAVDGPQMPQDGTNA